MLNSLTQTWTVLPLLPADDFDAMTRCRDLGLQGGAIYDTLIAQAALRARAVRLVTLNAKHFARRWSGWWLRQKFRTPSWLLGCQNRGDGDAPASSFSRADWYVQV